MQKIMGIYPFQHITIHEFWIITSRGRSVICAVILLCCLYFALTLPTQARHAVCRRAAPTPAGRQSRLTYFRLLALAAAASQAVEEGGRVAWAGPLPVLLPRRDAAPTTPRGADGHARVAAMDTHYVTQLLRVEGK